MKTSSPSDTTSPVPHYKDPLADTFERIQAGRSAPLPALLQAPPRYSWWEKVQLGREWRTMEKSVQTDYMRAQKRVQDAAAQGSMINASLDMWGAYDTAQGVVETQGAAFDFLRRAAHNCEPAAAIIGKRTDQIAAYCQPTESSLGYVRSAGFRIRLTDKSERASTEDRKKIAEYTQFFNEAGYCAPPAAERPVGWQPGLEHYVRCLIDDRLTLNWTATRTWGSALNRRAYPLVSFAAVDAALIRHRRAPVVGLKDGLPVTDPLPAERTNLPRSKNGFLDVTHVKLDGAGGGILEEYTDEELFCAWARVCTDESLRGYPKGEFERCIEAVTIWIAARTLNKLRFSQDTLPRGVLTVVGQLDQQQFQSFVQNWKAMLQGLKGRCTIPILHNKGTQGGGQAGMQWQPFDLSPKDMEQSQFMFNVALWMHAMFCIHPDETGYSSSSPFRPALSEASPASNLKYSQDSGLDTNLTWLENVMNRHLLWRLDPSRRFTFEFMGKSDLNETDDINLRQLRMNAGLTTPAMEWAELDINMPAEVRDHPAANFPAPFVVGVQTLQAMQQQGQEADQQVQGQQDDAAQAAHDRDTEQQEQERQQEQHEQGIKESDQSIAESKQAMAQQGMIERPANKPANKAGAVTNKTGGTAKSVDTGENVSDNGSRQGAASVPFPRQVLVKGKFAGWRGLIGSETGDTDA